MKQEPRVTRSQTYLKRNLSGNEKGKEGDSSFSESASMSTGISQRPEEIDGKCRFLIGKGKGKKHRKSISKGEVKVNYEYYLY